MRASKILITIFELMVLGQTSFKVFAADDVSYIGAVVEYYPVTNGRNGSTIAIANANNYVTIIEAASAYGTDVIVFPENSLTEGLTYSDTNRTLYPSFSSILPDAYTDVPCDNSSTVVIEALKLISCAAKKHSAYVVVNLSEKVNCTKAETDARPCPSDGYFFYNTNVVFNRTGGIVSKYRKYNLFNEPGFNITSTPEVATFTTDFNVTFGHIVCFDIYFKAPALTLINDYNITDILYPVRWFSELPYLTAVQTQSAWSHTNNVNLLASGYNNPATGNGGSGIHIGSSGSLVTLWSEKPKNALLVAKVPKVIGGKRCHIASSTYPVTYEFSDAEITTLNGTIDGERHIFQDYLKPYTTQILPLTNGTKTTSLELCDQQFCCSFYIVSTFNDEILSSNVSYYRYRIAVFNGVRPFYGGASAGTQICSVISCTNNTLASCGVRFATTDDVVQPTVFNNILISGNFATGSNTVQSLNSLAMDILPLNLSDFTFTETDLPGTSVRSITYNLTTETNNLLTFAVYGRNFSADGLAPILIGN